MHSQYDVIIIGAGVVGCITARWLSRYALRILLIEKTSDVCTGATAANSAVIHAGNDAVPGTLKARMNVNGNPLWDRLSEELQFEFSRCGAYILAVGKDEWASLDMFLERAHKNGVSAEIISAEEMRKREPNINPEVCGALFVPSGGVCDPWGATIAAAENAVMNGVELRLETEFHDFLWSDEEAGRIVGVQTNQGQFRSRWVINAAGLFADEVMHKAGVRPEFRITPRRGQYFVLDRSRIQVQNVLFPVPTAISKGILVTTTLHGNTLIGPNAENIQDKTEVDVTPEGMDEIWDGGSKLVPGIDRRYIIAVFAGLRPSGNAQCENPDVDYDYDFVIEVPGQVKGLVNLGGMDSPALTAAPAIAERVVALLQEAGEVLAPKTHWDPIRPARPVFRRLSHAEQSELVAKDSRYGRVICRCEYVTEGEIIAEIHAPISATTYDAIKRRTWLGTGRCLGGFDMPRVVDILARELGKDPLEITKKGHGSEFLFRKTKEVA
jgi:glycerol-3-phosphate dehydrogenase